MAHGTKYTTWTVSVETVRMVKSQPGKNQPQRSDLPSHIITFVFFFFSLRIKSSLNLIRKIAPELNCYLKIAAVYGT